MERVAPKDVGPEKDLLDGVEFYKFMAPNHMGEKVLRPPRRNDVNRSRRPAL